MRHQSGMPRPVRDHYPMRDKPENTDEEKMKERLQGIQRLLEYCYRKQGYIEPASRIP
jgi:hypothetical protein